MRKSKEKNSKLSFTHIREIFFSLANFWPPFLGAGIRVDEYSKDFRYMRVRLVHRFWNLNLVGTQYGGSIFSMADPFYMMMLIKNLGPDYIVWDKSSSIRYRKPGKTDLQVEFQLSSADLAQIKKQVLADGKIDFEREVIIKDKNGETIAEIKKVIQIKKR